MSETNYESEILNGMNKNCVRCRFCNSLMLAKQHGNYIKLDEEIHLPNIHLKNSKDQSTAETEPVSVFWMIDDMFQFENIGFSNTVDNRKYLTCADCDMGPVGYHDIDVQKKYYVALNRVKHSAIGGGGERV